LDHSGAKLLNLQNGKMRSEIVVAEKDIVIEPVQGAHLADHPPCIQRNSPIDSGAAPSVGSSHDVDQGPKMSSIQREFREPELNIGLWLHFDCVGPQVNAETQLWRRVKLAALVLPFHLEITLA
jgi:hypothetical protein